MIGTLAVDGWAVTFGTARRGLGLCKMETLLLPPKRIKLRSSDYFGMQVDSATFKASYKNGR